MQRFTVFLIFLILFSIILLNFTDLQSTFSYAAVNTSNISGNKSPFVSVATVKPGNKWIVVTSINNPTEDVKRLSTFEKWNLVVVADTKTPIDWKLDGVHFLSVEYQRTLPFSLIHQLPYKSYTRKNIGYLYAISNGAEWIYDTDDDNKPFGKGLEQFVYEEQVGGVRYRLENGTDTRIQNRLFNPYRFYGLKSMWPRGFPLEYLKEHTNGVERMSLCAQMARPAVQQGLVHHDPDVDAIYRLLNADPTSGLDERFNEFAPPITLSPGTYSPWNSQNTLFYKSAFHTLFLPTTVSFRTTDIWRSYFAQKILHLSGLSIAFTPVNAVQFRNPHSFLKDFEDELQVYSDAGKIVNFLNEWKCNSSSIEECMIDLAHEFVAQQFWTVKDAEMIGDYIEDLKILKFEFPKIVNGSEDLDYKMYTVKTNETGHGHNCRRMSLTFGLDLPGNDTEPALERASKKIEYFGEIGKWCNESGYYDLLKTFPSPEELAEEHLNDYVLKNQQKNVLIITNNFDWNRAIGLLQRMYQPYFALVIFCGTWNETYYNENDKGFPKMMAPFNYIHMNRAEMNQGYGAYHCLTLAYQLNLQNVQGYFIMSDDTTFNIWQRIDFTRVHHAVGIHGLNENNWWYGDYGLNRAREIIQLMNTTNDSGLKKTWMEFETRLRKFKYIKDNETAANDLLQGKSRSVSDFYYVPSSEMDYYSRLMNIFFNHQLFLELAVNRFLRTVNHQTSRYLRDSYLWGNRGKWAEIYTEEMVSMHPVKMSMFAKPDNTRKRYCSTILATWADILILNSGNYTVKGDGDEDLLNG